MKRGTFMAKTISQILDRKGHNVCGISPGDRVYDALALMADNNVGALVVLEDDRVVGIFTERDNARKIALYGLSSQETSLRQVMSVVTDFVTPQTSVEEAMAIVTESRHRHLPVMENGQLVGLVSIGDLVKASLDEKEFVIDQLTKHIKGEC
jgi:CBS domain-containing protein